MHKLIFSAIPLFCILFLCSCSRLGAPIVYNNNGEKADARLEQVIEALENQDNDALKALFSKNAVDAADDFDDSMSALFDFFQGEVDSWERPSGPTVYESIDHGQKMKEVYSFYYVNTNVQKYFFLLQDYPIDTENPDNVGLYLLLVVKAEDEEKIWDGDNKIIYDGDTKITHIGIYLPITDSDNESAQPSAEVPEGEEIVQPS